MGIIPCSESKMTHRGADCLSLVFRHLGVHIAPADIHEHLSAKSDLLRSMAKFARHKGFFGMKQRCDIHTLQNFHHPVITRLGDYGFIVLERTDSSGFVVLDPLVGRRFLDHHSFTQMYQGAVLHVMARQDSHHVRKDLLQRPWFARWRSSLS